MKLEHAIKDGDCDLDDLLADFRFKLEQTIAAIQGFLEAQKE
jgi:hypothetical protein